MSNHAIITLSGQQIRDLGSTIREAVRELGDGEPLSFTYEWTKQADFYEMLDVHTLSDTAKHTLVFSEEEYAQLLTFTEAFGTIGLYETFAKAGA